MDTAVNLEFGDATYRFWLPMARIVEIERLCGDKSILTMWEEFGAAVGIQKDDGAAVFLGGGASRIKDVYEVIRCAAIGGGSCQCGDETKRVSALDAKALVDNYVDGRPYSETVPVAWAILNAAITGVSLKKKVSEPAPARKRSAKAKSSPTAVS